jgi:hypothetical protein
MIPRQEGNSDQTIAVIAMEVEKQTALIAILKGKQEVESRALAVFALRLPLRPRAAQGKIWSIQ